MGTGALRYGGMKQPTSEQGALRTTTLSIGGMSCGACVRHVTKALDGMTGVVSVDVHLATNEATVEHLPTFTDETALIAAIRDAGYEATVISTKDEAAMETGPGALGTRSGCGCCGLAASSEAATTIA